MSFRIQHSCVKRPGQLLQPPEDNDHFLGNEYLPLHANGYMSRYYDRRDITTVPLIRITATVRVRLVRPVTHTIQEKA